MFFFSSIELLANQLKRDHCGFFTQFVLKRCFISSLPKLFVTPAAASLVMLCSLLGGDEAGMWRRWVRSVYSYGIQMEFRR